MTIDQAIRFLAAAVMQNTEDAAREGMNVGETFAERRNWTLHSLANLGLMEKLESQIARLTEETLFHFGELQMDLGDSFFLLAQDGTPYNVEQTCDDFSITDKDGRILVTIATSPSAKDDDAYHNRPEVDESVLARQEYDTEASKPFAGQTDGRQLIVRYTQSKKFEA